MKSGKNTKTSGKNVVIQGVGWFGVLLILGAYFSVSFQYLSPNSFWYQGMNILGSIGIIVEAVSKGDYQPAVLNIVWILIAIFAIVRVLLSYAFI